MANKVQVTCYTDKKTRDRWQAHIKTTRPQYTSLSHLLEDAVEYKIEADKTPLNKMFGFVGPVDQRK